MNYIKKNFSLKNYNSFKLDVTTSTFAKFSSLEQLNYLLKKNNKKLLILGGGSNLLFTKNFEGTILYNNICGISIIKENKQHITVKVGAGELWDNFVSWSVNNNYSGIENLALIPGNVGACPIQNIGAYGMEVKDTIEKVIAVEIKSNKIKEFKNVDCKFKYRESIFKKKLKNKYIITHVLFKLSKSHLNITSYGDVSNELKKLKLETNPKNISLAVSNIRNKKLPNPKQLANCGSFFKNPTITRQKFEKLKKKFPEIIGYQISEQKIKIAAGWLIDNAGMKGYRIGDAGVHKNQALVLVNYGNASGKDILNLAKIIKKKIKEIYNIELKNEVTII
ncbi:MAG: UDP-N-acetylenolpyruvoylglucosamine reductase [Flavobacteriales bacterium]|nr:UDP-N-acetylenolpyruvoylglucosamine reductase [Flavobacteriales bacterium]